MVTWQTWCRRFAVVDAADEPRSTLAPHVQAHPAHADGDDSRLRGVRRRTDPQRRRRRPRKVLVPAARQAVSCGERRQPRCGCLSRARPSRRRGRMCARGSSLPLGVRGRRAARRRPVGASASNMASRVRGGVPPDRRRGSSPPRRDPERHRVPSTVRQGRTPAYRCSRCSSSGMLPHLPQSLLLRLSDERGRHGRCTLSHPDNLAVDRMRRKRREILRRDIWLRHRRGWCAFVDRPRRRRRRSR